MLTAQKDLNKFEVEILGESPQIRKVIATAKKIAKSSSITTLIYGESGTGKELVARLIHNLSNSSNQPFVDINCGAIPETLLESELFGYEKGAFTGAQMRKQGLFELANGGTIFLDEIGNITTTFQIKLLKAVENKRFRRISGMEEIRVSTRIIAATNINLREAADAGKFREDLYYRLNVCQIFIPPLRHRGNDVLILAQHFIDHFNREYDRQVKGLAPSAVR
ncbi:MAG: sigma 54-interacting transcriptional regulator, partial [bacterium]